MGAEVAPPQQVLSLRTIEPSIVSSEGVAFNYPSICFCTCAPALDRRTDHKSGAKRDGRKKQAGAAEGQQLIFLDTGKGRITIINGSDSTLELQGNTLPAKIFSGFVNWLFHCISDVAGSSGNRGPGAGPGTGLPIPFTEFFQFCNFGKLKNEKGQNQTIATVMVKVYEEGYDLRHGVSTSVPVLVNDLLLRAVFVIKQHFYEDVSWTDLLRKKNEDKLQRMISVGTGALCLLDLSEAAITSWGNWVVFFSHLNISAWNRLAIQGIKELHILSDREMHNIEMIESEITEKREELLQRSKMLLE